MNCPTGQRGAETIARCMRRPPCSIFVLFPSRSIRDWCFVKAQSSVCVPLALPLQVQTVMRTWEAAAGSLAHCFFCVDEALAAVKRPRFSCSSYSSPVVDSVLLISNRTSSVTGTVTWNGVVIAVRYFSGTHSR